ncbi:hypothetical protein [Massilia sp. TN1-12]|uniref:hypothetical protein n=1 Tax=Massilia paldalensis TaxID=3377675 RepID=UPI00384EE452
MDDEKQPLRCPSCGSEGDFKIAATVWVRVAGADSLAILDEEGDREYGSEDACRCDDCGHQARMGDFYKEEE